MGKSLVAAAATATMGLMMGGMLIIGGGGAQTASGAVATGFAIACTLSIADVPRVEAAMLILDPDPVHQEQWDTYRSLIELPDQAFDPDTGEPILDANGNPTDINGDPWPLPYDYATDTQKRDLFDKAIRSFLTGADANALSGPYGWYGWTPANNDAELPIDAAEYLARYTETFSTNQDVLAVATVEPQCTPGTAAGFSGCINGDSTVAAALATIRYIESRDTYTAQASGSSASGAYQFVDGTWNNYGGYAHAKDAPAAIQDARAAQDVQYVLTKYGDVAFVPLYWYLPASITNTELMDRVPAGNVYTPREYQQIWLTRYRAQPDIDCAAGGAAAIAWGRTQSGAPYAAISPYRFGQPRWPGGTLTGDRGDRYTFAAGTTVYDCSGFVIAAWRQAGIDFTAMGIYGSQGFITSRIPDAPRNALIPGDIIVYSPSNGVGHVVLVDHVNPDGTVATLEASPTGGVHIGKLNWLRATAFKRPA